MNYEKSSEVSFQYLWRKGDLKLLLLPDSASPESVGEVERLLHILGEQSRSQTVASAIGTLRNLFDKKSFQIQNIEWLNKTI